jgi:hypothetical protein
VKYDFVFIAINIVTFLHFVTFRSFVSEDKEYLKFESLEDKVLYYGEKVEWAEIITKIIQKYLEVMVQVLILWYYSFSRLIYCLILRYGGSIVMANKSQLGTLTLGDLWSFTVYWNMLKDNYKTINDVWIAFRKASMFHIQVSFSLINSGCCG